MLLLIEFGTLALVFDADLAATVGAFTAALIALAAVLPALAGWQPLAPRPELELRLELSGPAVAAAGQGCPVPDVKAIVAEQRVAALASLPARPAPDTSFDHAAGRGAASIARALSASASFSLLNSVPTEQQRSAFEARVDNYEDELRQWLAGLEPALWARCSQLGLRVVIANTSDRAAARDLDVDVDLPPGLRVPTDHEEPDDPPRRPHWRPPDPFGAAGLLDLRVPSFGAAAFPPPEDLRDRPDGSGTRWSVALPRLLHARTLETSRELELELDRPGGYEIQAVARTTGLDRPTVQTASLDVDGRGGPTLATMHALKQYLRLDDDDDPDAP